MSESVAKETERLLSTVPDEISQLIDRCLKGEEEAYIAVYNLLAASIFRLCFGLLQNKEDAEEVLQDSFEYAFRKLTHYDKQKASFKTWLFQIAISRSRNKRRRRWLDTVPLTQFLGEQVVDESALSPTEALALSERQRMIWLALYRLSPKLRETTVLRFYEGLTYAEIGKVLSIPSKTAESRMRLAYASLKRDLSEDLE